MTTQQTDALQCAADLEYSIARHGMQDAFTLNAYRAMKMVRTQHARITELESQLAQSFDAADMATASAQGFRDVVASASPVSEQVANNRPSLEEVFRRLSDRAYCNFIEQMGSDVCLGWKYKARHGMFGEAELKGHTIAGEMLGRHKAFAEAANALRGSDAPLRAVQLVEASHLANALGTRKVLWNLLGECLPVIDALMQMPGDDDSDAHLNGLAGRINDARTAVQAEELPGATP